MIYGRQVNEDFLKIILDSRKAVVYSTPHWRTQMLTDNYYDECCYDFSEQISAGYEWAGIEV